VQYNYIISTVILSHLKVIISAFQFVQLYALSASLFLYAVVEINTGIIRDTKYSKIVCIS